MRHPIFCGWFFMCARVWLRVPLVWSNYNLNGREQKEAQGILTRHRYLMCRINWEVIAPWWPDLLCGGHVLDEGCEWVGKRRMCRSDLNTLLVYQRFAIKKLLKNLINFCLSFSRCRYVKNPGINFLGLRVSKFEFSEGCWRNWPKTFWPPKLSWKFA